MPIHQRSPHTYRVGAITAISCEPVAAKQRSIGRIVFCRAACVQWLIVNERVTLPGLLDAHQPKRQSDTIVATT
jgi:hypothetical protein